MVNQFQLLVGADAFVAALRESLPTCRNNLYVQFSTFEGDSSGQAFAEMLIDRADQGADVRLTVDYYSDVVINDAYPILIHRRREVQNERNQTHTLFDRLEQHNILIRRTAPPGFMGRYMLYRDHKKMVILDDHTAFVGGINVSDHNYAWHDFMVKITGPLVHDLIRDYQSSWDGRTIPMEETIPNGDFVLNQCAGRYPIFQEILNMLGSARHSLVIVSPYLMGDHIEPAILQAAQRGVSCTLIIPFRSNKLVYRIWARKMLRRFNHPNIQIYGFQGEHNMTHAKLVIADDERATFGSFNMFELEGLTQKELNIFTNNADLINQLNQFVAQNLSTSVLLPVPRTTFGRFTYTVLYHFFKWWTNRLVSNREWKAIYC